MRSTVLHSVRIERGSLLEVERESIVSGFRMKTADAQYKEGFFDELRAFRERVQTRAKQKVEDALKQYEEVTSIHYCCRTSKHHSASLRRKNDRNA